MFEFQTFSTKQFSKDGALRAEGAEATDQNVNKVLRITKLILGGRMQINTSSSCRLFAKTISRPCSRLLLSTSQDDFNDNLDDIFGLSGCKRDKIFYARCFRLLELENDSSQELVRTQYIKLAKIHHPDSGQVASLKRFQRIDQAYRELIKKFDEDKRKDEKSVGEFGLYYEPDDHPEASEAKDFFDINHTAPQHR